MTELSDAAAEGLSKHKGDLYLNDLTKLSDKAVESLSKHKYTLCISEVPLKKLSVSAAEFLAKHKGDDLFLDQYSKPSKEVIDVLSAKKIGTINGLAPSKWAKSWK